MFSENGPQGEPKHEQGKVPLKEFRAAAQENLEGTNLLGLISETSLQTDSEGNLEALVVENLKKMLRVGYRMSPDQIVKSKIAKMIVFIESY